LIRLTRCLPEEPSGSIARGTHSSGGFDHAATAGSGALLILTSEVVFSLGTADFLENVKRLTPGMRSLAGSTADYAAASEGYNLILFILFAVPSATRYPLTSLLREKRKHHDEDVALVPMRRHGVCHGGQLLDL